MRARPRRGFCVRHSPAREPGSGSRFARPSAQELVGSSSGTATVGTHSPWSDVHPPRIPSGARTHGQPKPLFSSPRQKYSHATGPRDVSYATLHTSKQPVQSVAATYSSTHPLSELILDRLHLRGSNQRLQRAATLGCGQPTRDMRLLWSVARWLETAKTPGRDTSDE
ncbi:hypothetical protein GW17_00057838 [Ensete ventricosum]|nr:hypothetical protein GW17_00057838 [Ensete ventricosum]